jgi:phage terminase small subunit
MALTDKQEKFSQAYVLHHNASEAARVAGYNTKYAHTQGYKLLKEEAIQERIKELENNLETNVNVVSEIETQYSYAKQHGHTNSAIKALELLSRIRGGKSDKEIDISPESLESNIIDSLKILGKKKVMEFVKKCKF